MIDHPDILTGGLPVAVCVRQGGAPPRRLESPEAISDAPAELARRGYSLDTSDALTADYAAGYEVAADAPYTRAAVVGFALSRISPVADTARYRLVSSGSDSELIALSAAGDSLAIWTIRGGGVGQPTSVSRQ